MHKLRPLIDEAWYVARTGAAYDPVLHWIDFGRAAGHAPNAFFDPAWYARTHGLASGEDPLSHYIDKGAALRLDPSPEFSTGFYLDHYRDVRERGDNPLAHYLAHGRSERRSARPPRPDALPAHCVTLAEYKTPIGGPNAAIFITHSPTGRVAPHLQAQLRALVDEGVAVTLVVATDQPLVLEPWMNAITDGLYARQELGWDFAAWAHVLRQNPQFFSCELLLWINDSLFGPHDAAAFSHLLRRVRASTAALVGLTTNLERADRCQSCFLAFGRPALRSAAFARFVADMRCLHLEEDVINAYDHTLADRLSRSGLRTETLSLALDGTGLGGRTTDDRRKPLDEERNPMKRLELLAQPELQAEVSARGPTVLGAEPPLPTVPPAPRPVQHPLALFIGPSNYANGLGVAARGYLRALVHGGIQASILPIEPPFHVHARVSPALAYELPGKPDVALVHLNPEAWADLLTPLQATLISNARRRVGLFVWESDLLPAIFAAHMARCDAIWAPSRYAAAAFRSAGHDRVRVLPYPLALRDPIGDPARIAVLRAFLGLIPDARVMLFSFDASSHLERKNPQALVRAFATAELARNGWTLLLKTKNLNRNQPAVADLLSLVQATPGAQVLNLPLPVDDANALLDLADIYVSPHASEGFGLTVAEAMAAGKPVIATDFGGTTDLLDAGCGFPVAFRPWQLDADLGPYRAGSNWARIDEAALARTLREVASLSSDARDEIGKAGRARVADRLSPAAIGATMRVLLDEVLTL